MNEHDAWTELLNATKEAVVTASVSFKWVPPNRIAFFNRWQVQARFVKEPSCYSIFFERFGAELGRVNYEPTPGSGNPKVTVLTMLPKLGEGKAFWQLADGRTLKSEILARWAIDRLPLFHDEYGRSVLGIGI